MMNWFSLEQLVGYVASVMIVVSMVFKTRTYKGTMYMRTLNFIGSIIFIVYGFLISAYATAFANIAAAIINIVFLYKEYNFHKKEKQNEQKY